MALSYTLREGIAGFRRAKLAAATSVAALAIALVLIGIFALLGWQGQNVAESLRQRASEVEVFLDDGAEISLGDSRLLFTLREFPDRESALKDHNLRRWFGEEDRPTLA